MDIVVELGDKVRSLENQLAFLSRQLELHQRFLRHKFQREFEDFTKCLEQIDVSNSNYCGSSSGGLDNPDFSEASGPTSTWSRTQTVVQCSDFEDESFSLSGFVEPAEGEYADFYYTHFGNTLRLTNSDLNEEVPSELHTPTPRKSEESNSPSGVKGLQQFEENKKENLPQRPCLMKSRRRRPNGTEKKRSPTTKETGDRAPLDANFENMWERDEDDKEPFASLGTTEDSSSSRDKCGEGMTMLSVGFRTQKTKLVRKAGLRGSSATRPSIILPRKQNQPKEKRFQCSVCPKKFLYPAALRDHQLTHTDEKPHECSQCDKSYRLVSHLRRHQKLTHANEANPHPCSFCSKLFRDLTDLRRHEQNHRPTK